MIGLWLTGLLSRRSGRLLGAVVGVALTVALLAVLGSFIAASAGSMTQRAITAVPVDWQLLLAPGADPQMITHALREATLVTALEPVGYADVAGFSASTGGTVQTTGPGKVLGISPQYRQQFPAELRPLIGSLDGVLVAQQTSANLHVTIGDRVTILRMGLPPVDVAVAGVADLPQADSLFQAVGVPPGTAPQAPPDNVLLLPADQWHALFDPQAAARPDSVRTQLHVQIGHDLPADPGAAFIAVQQRARNVEARIAGSGVIGDNLAARLDGARADALYAEVLLLFLGLPGIILAMLLTVAVAASGAARHRQEQALLRTRGATTAQILWLEATEALLAGGSGMILGLALAAGAAFAIMPEVRLFSWATLGWLIGAALIGVGLALVAVLLPAWHMLRQSTVAAARRAVGRATRPLWQRLYLDLIILAATAVMFWRTASTGYQLVLAPEGVAQTAVAYESFLAPLGLWVGVALLTLRVWSGGLARGQRMLAALLRPVARGLAGLVAVSLGRQRVLHTRGVVLVALACAFATSTAVFNTTYNAQAQVDAELTNGADVLVRGTSGAPPSSKLHELAALPGVAAAQPMQHRFAYVGTDLQDLFGIDPTQIGRATSMANAYFANGDAQATLAALAARPDAVLVSEETMNDFQLTPGDQLNLRLQSAHDNQYHVVPFHFVGVVREFPTAPKDSFLVANASYIAQQTGTDAAEIVLLRTTGNAAVIAQAAQAVVAPLPGARVTDISTTQQVISSSLTAVDLRGLTALELLFAVLLVIGATGLVLALSLIERRRTFAILAALGARTSQLGAFIWSEGLLLLIGGCVIGIAVGLGVAQMLVALLTHVFDPPPETLAVPWGYLSLLVGAAVVSIGAAVASAQRAAARLVIESLREL
jgi:putative ABC transport system permease protein